MKEQAPEDRVYMLVERYDQDGSRQMTDAEFDEYKATLDRLEAEGLESRTGMLLYNETTKEPYGFDIQRKELEIKKVVGWINEELPPPPIVNPPEGLSLADKIKWRLSQ